MTTDVSDLAEKIAFERYVLARTAPLLPNTQATSTIYLDDDSAPVIVSTSDSWGGSSKDTPNIDDIRPLFFGVAWKVLDQMIEFCLEQSGKPPNRGSDYSNDLKVKEAKQGRISPLPPFDRRPDIWHRTMKSYALTQALRDSLVHRRLAVDPSTGDMWGSPKKPGQPMPKTLTADQQSAFCRLADGIAEAAIEGDLSIRREDQLTFALDHLVPHHGEPAFGTAAARGVIPRVIVHRAPGPTNQVTLDFADLGNRARAKVGGVSYYDVELHLPDGRVLSTALEEAPAEPVTFSIDSPPNWLQWK